MTNSTSTDCANGGSQQVLILLLLGTSASIRSNDNIGRVNALLSGWPAKLLISVGPIGERAEIAIVAFGGQGVVAVDVSGAPGVPGRPFAASADFRPAALTADGPTPMVEAVEHGLAMIDQRRGEILSTNPGVRVRPMMFLVTDGHPTDLTGRPSQHLNTYACRGSGNRLLEVASPADGAPAVTTPVHHLFDHER